MYYDSAGTKVYTGDDPEYYTNGASVNNGYAWGTRPPGSTTTHYVQNTGRGGQGGYWVTEPAQPQQAAPAAPPAPPAPPPAQQQAQSLQDQQTAALNDLAAQQQASYDAAMAQSAQLQADMLANQQQQTDYMNQTLALQQQQQAQAAAEQDRAYAQASYQQQLLGNNLALTGQQTAERQATAQSQNQMGVFNTTEAAGVDAKTQNYYGGQGKNPNGNYTNIYGVKGTSTAGNPYDSNTAANGWTQWQTMSDQPNLKQNIPFWQRAQANYSLYH